MAIFSLDNINNGKIPRANCLETSISGNIESSISGNIEGTHKIKELEEELDTNKDNIEELGDDTFKFIKHQLKINKQSKNNFDRLNRKVTNYGTNISEKVDKLPNLITEVSDRMVTQHSVTTHELFELNEISKDLRLYSIFILLISLLNFIILILNIGGL